MQCVEKPDRIEVRQRPDGLADCFIRRNIHQVTDGDGVKSWEADEVQFTGTYTLAMVQDNEDALWRMFNPTPLNERIATAEGIQAAQDDAIIELYELVMGE